MRFFFSKSARGGRALEARPFANAVGNNGLSIVPRLSRETHHGHVFSCIIPTRVGRRIRSLLEEATAEQAAASLLHATLIHPS